MKHGRILHYPVPSYGSTMITQPVPKGSKILSAMIREGMPTVYVQCPTDESGSELLDVFYVGTGWEFNDGQYDFIGTVQYQEFFWHVYGLIGHK